MIVAERKPGPTREVVDSTALGGTRPTERPSGVSTRSGGDTGNSFLSAFRSRAISAAWKAGSLPSRIAASSAPSR
jgi:hypothetical protein